MCKEARMFDSPASATSDSRSPRGYFCAACKRRHDGQAFGSVGRSLEYCEPAITHLVSSGLIAKDARDSAGPQQYSLIKRDR
jgi:hypothetical protein